MSSLQKELLGKLGMRDQISLHELCNAVQDVLGEELISIVLYGNATLHDYHPEMGDKKVLIVVKQIDISMLKSVLKPINKAKELGFQSLMMTQRNLEASTDVFPIKYISMKESHVLLKGQDVLEGLEIRHDYLRLRCEQELRIVSQRLEEHYLNERGKLLKQAMCIEIMDFIETLRVAVTLKTKQMPSWSGAVEAVSKTYDIEASILSDIIKLRNDEIKQGKKAIEELYARFMSFVDELIGIVDQLD
ncbi:MAG: hypothetical protein JXQ90_03465 [Cyclobacteriaceae bacterium]